MDINNIDLNEYDFIAPTEISYINTKPTNFIDITVEEDNTFYIYSSKNDNYILTHNCDGSHIKGLYLGFFIKYAPQLLKNGIIKMLRTPLIVLKDKKNQKIKEIFFDFNAYNNWLSKHDLTKYNIDYKKGLGSWKKDEWDYLLKEYGFEYFIESIEFDSNAASTINDWLGSDQSDTRKELLKQNKFSMIKI